MVKVQVIQDDALKYMRPIIAPAIFTSMPDAEEMGLGLPEWEFWFKNAAHLMITGTAPKGYTFFYQTDRRHDGKLISKASMIIQAAQAEGRSVIMHKICQTTKGVNFFRPGYTHLIGISEKGTAGRPTSDVMPAGRKLYKNATGYDACTCVFDFLLKKGIKQVYDPFCGAGSIGYIGAKMGFDSVNIDIDGQQCLAATVLIQSVKDAQVTILSGQRKG